MEQFLWISSPDIWTNYISAKETHNSVYYIFYDQFTAKYFHAIAILSTFTPTLLKCTAIKLFDEIMN
jgi:hypothetical protein